MPTKPTAEAANASVGGDDFSFRFLGFLFHVASRLCGVRGVESHMVPASALTAVLLVLRPSLWPIPLAGAVSFTLVYPALPALMLGFQPHLLSHWNTANLSGNQVLGVPIEEALWALRFGATWPLFMACVFDGHVSTSGARDAAAQSGPEHPVTTCRAAAR